MLFLYPLQLAVSSFHNKVATQQKAQILELGSSENECTALRLCDVVSNRSWRCVSSITMQQPVSGMQIAHGLMHSRSQDFEWGEG